MLFPPHPTAWTHRRHNPILTCDVWDHAHYVDYRNRRAEYLEAFWKVTNWNLAARNLLD